jgi:hypothetical protein
MTESILILGCLVVLVAFVHLVVRFRTLLLGFNALHVILIAAATLPTFFFGTLFGALPDTFTAESLEVVSYAIPALLAMILGIHLGWRPLLAWNRPVQGSRRFTLSPPHFRGEMGLVTFSLGIIADVIYPVVYTVPTLSTAVYAMSMLTRVGLCLLLVDALSGGRLRYFIAAATIATGTALVGALLSGFSFIRVNSLIPLLVIWITIRGWSWRIPLGVFVALPALLVMISAWLETRNTIRSGLLQHLSTLDQLTTYLEEYWAALGPPTIDLIMNTIVERIDQTELLTHQISWQPEMEPYAYGETIYSSLYTLIPRLFWEDKPVIAGGSEFVARFTGVVRTADDPTSVGIVYPFELYANGGPIWVVIGMALLGYIGARMELAMFERPKDLGRFWALAVTTIVVCEGGQRTDVVLPALVAAGLTAYAFGRIVEQTELGRRLLARMRPPGGRRQ